MLMNINTGVRRSLAVSLILLSIGLVGCGTTGRTDARYHRQANAWYDYNYYPSLDIYHEINTGFYWYIDQERWIRGRNLPPKFILHRYKPVYLHLDIDRPYRLIKEHRDRYLPRKHESRNPVSVKQQHPPNREKDTHQQRPNNKGQADNYPRARHADQRRRENVRRKIPQRETRHRTDTPDKQKHTERRPDDKAYTSRPGLQRRGTVRDDIPQHNVNRPVDASLKQKRDLYRSGDNNLRGVRRQQSQRAKTPKETSKPVANDRRDSYQSRRQNERRTEDRAPAGMKDSDGLLTPKNKFSRDRD